MHATLTNTQSADSAASGKRQILPDAVYTTDEAAVICCVMPSTIRAAVRTGILKGKGRPYRFRGIELFKML